jgi:prepilin-type N-terminal cleavage/methylation domain-containing protein
MNCKPRNQFKHCRKEKGFTLIEVLIALAIFSIGILAVASLQTSLTGRNTSARISTEASIWSRDRVESLMLLPYNSSPQLDPGPAGLGPPLHQVTQGQYTVRWDVWDETGTAPGGIVPSANTKIIRVTVIGPRNNRSATVTFVRGQDV